MLAIVGCCLSLTLSGCGSSGGAVGNSYLKRLGLRPHQLNLSIVSLRPEIDVKPASGNGVQFKFLASASDARTLSLLNNVTAVSFVLFSEKGELLDSITIDNLRSAPLNTGSPITLLSGDVIWTPPSDDIKRFRLVSLVRSGESVWLSEKIADRPNGSSIDPVAVGLQVKELDRGLEFKVNAVRNLPPPLTEHQTTDEAYRVAIYEGPTRIWSTSDGKSFSHTSRPVEPSSVGEEKVYTVKWNGTKSSGEPLPEGTYRIVATIPAEPVAYTTQTTINWSPRN